MATAVDEPLLSGDPTQRLLTALGRFQRQVAAAESGAAHEVWSDEAMQQLINAIEIAIGEDWNDIREALTDTARILQTYEDAGRVSECMPFLQDSYEILCLMVGDLIVGNVRSGVVQKWRERYEVAVANVARDGLDLVDDDAPRHAPAPPREAFETPPAADAAAFDAEPERFDVDFEPAPAEDEAAAAVDAVFAEPEPPAHAAFEVESAAPELEEPPFDAPEFDAGPAAFDDALPSLDEAIAAAPTPGETAEAPAAESAAISIEEPEPPAPEAEAAPPVPSEPAASEAPPAGPEALMSEAQAAMRAGRVADAKRMMLQLAAEMARLEADQAGSVVTRIEGLLEEDARLIADGEAAAAACEKSVKDTDWLIGERQADLDRKHGELAGLREHLQEVEAGIANIEEKLRALMDEKAREEAHRAEVEAQLTQAEGDQADTQADLDALVQAQGKAGLSLDNARQRLAELVAMRQQHDTGLVVAREELGKRKLAVDEIEKTLNAALGIERSPDEGMLF